MTSSPRPDLAPDPALSRSEMEALQREIADAAVFADDLAFDATAITGLESDTDARSSAVSPPQSQPADVPLVAGVDQAFSLADERAISAVVVTRAGEVVERVSAVTPLEIPYVPGLLSFREGGPILAALEELTVEPDLYLFDGSGRIHFRQAGLATHIGAVRDVPAIGVAKRLLCGTPAGDLENLPRGARVVIEADERVDAPAGTALGYALQTKQYDSPKRYVNPLYVSPGHRVGLETAADAVLALTAGYKLPEPIRLADAYAAEVKAGLE
ncbi:endonuclease V [Natronobiforma cellulositropha]|uniref:endonuclease V n=1 Tax=Natronobiforma cellulositropha TaxID=1679076 RepID=UPI0021D5912C|nr:endonuclease V [Natronobiforma cellulositropha]